MNKDMHILCKPSIVMNVRARGRGQNPPILFREVGQPLHIAFSKQEGVVSNSQTLAIIYLLCRARNFL